jgi:hypothetical protein
MPSHQVGMGGVLGRPIESSGFFKHGFEQLLFRLVLLESSGPPYEFPWVLERMWRHR